MKHTINKEDTHKSGVYKITNLITKDFYIGYTKDLINRYRDHLCALGNGKSRSIILQSAVIKYGLDNFEFSVLEVCENYVEKEIELMDKLQPKYNIVKETQQKRIYSAETLARMSASQKGRVPWNKGKTGYHVNRIVKKKVISTDKEGNQIVHDNVEEAANFFKFSQSSIYQCCLGDRNSLFGIKFNYTS